MNIKRTILAICLGLVSLSALGQVSGRVADTDGKPLKDVGVSDGVRIVKTDDEGFYQIDTDKKYGYVFVITPSGYEPVTRDGLTPAFFKHMTKPEGIREDVNFSLKAIDQSQYKLMIMTDLHLTNDPGKGDQFAFRYFMGPFIKNVSDRLLEEGPAYCLQLGDLSHEVYWYLMDYDLSDAYNTLKQSGMRIPTYSVPGNHENDGAVVAGDNTDFEAGHLYRKVLGPEYYSFNVGGDHVLMMDNIIYINTPGKGKKVVGINGKRNFYTGFTKDQMEFLKADLKDLPDSTRIILGTHAPLITGPQGTFWRDKAQMDTLVALFSRFREFHAFAGHVHRMRHLHSDKYGIDNTAITALSGNMWTTGPNKDLGEAGEDTGVVVCDVFRDTLVQRYISRRYGENPFRIYDMNAVRDYYRDTPAVRSYFKKYAQNGATDYADSSRYTNKIRVNCWAVRPGYKLEIYENGEALKVTPTEEEDPLYFISHFIPRLAGPFFADNKNLHKNAHMWEAQASTPDGIIAVCLKDDKDCIVAQRMLRRPIYFGPDMSSDGTLPKRDVSLDTTPCQVRLVQRSSSALVYEFSATHFTDITADCSRDWRVALYSDSSCKNLVQSWDLVRQQNNPNEAVFRGFDADRHLPRICFSGLAPGTRYWCKAYDITDTEKNAPESEAVRGTTESFEVVTLGKKGTAAPGDVLLAENFGEITSGGWWLGGKYAVGNCATSKFRTDAYQFDLGKKFRYDSRTEGYPIVDNRAAYYGSYQFALSPEMLHGTRLADWGCIVIDNKGNRVDENRIYAHPGYLVCGAVEGKAGAGNRNAILLTPPLRSLEKGRKATVRVTYRCQKYAQSDADLKVYAGTVDGISLWGTKNPSAALDGVCTYDSEKPQYISTTDIAMGSSNGYRTFEVSGVTSSSRIFIGIRPDQTQGKKAEMFTHRRYCITNVTIELVSYED